MCNSGKVLLALVNDILDFAKLEAGKFDFVSDPFDLRALIGNPPMSRHPCQRKRSWFHYGL